MIFSSRFDSKALRQSVVVGVIVALALLGGGVAYALTQHRTWAAESMVVVLPATSLDDATSASYYETLSRGQIVATFAEVAGSLGFEQQAEDRLGLTAGQRAQSRPTSAWCRTRRSSSSGQLPTTLMSPSGWWRRPPICRCSTWPGCRSRTGS
jgi:hypothetical protein